MLLFQLCFGPVPRITTVLLSSSEDAYLLGRSQVYSLLEHIFTYRNTACGSTAVIKDAGP